jgi:hypothetical protein
VSEYGDFFDSFHLLLRELDDLTRCIPTHSSQQMKSYLKKLEYLMKLNIEKVESDGL